MSSRPSLVVPVENQVRELDPKLLVACAAAERGFRVILGSRTEVDFRVASFPRGFYLAKGMTPKNARMFDILDRLGFAVAVLEEEALVYLFPEHYYWRKMGAESVRHARLLLAWGGDNAELFRKSPVYDGTPIRVVGNPRGDLLRPELRAFHEPEAARLRERFGGFVLVNTNFSMVNAFLPTQNLLVPGDPGEPPRLGAAAYGVTREFAEAQAAHKGALYEHFRRLLPELARRLPERRFVLRPHPGERFEPWRELAAELPNVHVECEGSVVPWLLAARALVHNGCTTAVEAAVLGLPALSYRPVVAERYDFALPNALSHECASPEAVAGTLERILSGAQGPLPPGRPRPLDEYLAAREGELASDRIAEALRTELESSRGLPRPDPWTRASGWWRATRRSFSKRFVKARVPGHRNNPDFQRHRFRGVSVEEVRERVERLGRALGRFGGVRVRPLGPRIFRIEVR